MPGSTKTNEAVGLSAGVLHLCGYQSHPRSLVALSSTLRRPLIWSAILCVSSFRVAHRCGAYFPPPPPLPHPPQSPSPLSLFAHRVLSLRTTVARERKRPCPTTGLCRRSRLRSRSLPTETASMSYGQPPIEKESTVTIETADDATVLRPGHLSLVLGRWQSRHGRPNGDTWPLTHPMMANERGGDSGHLVIATLRGRPGRGGGGTSVTAPP